MSAENGQLSAENEQLRLGIERDSRIAQLAAERDSLVASFERSEQTHLEALRRLVEERRAQCERAERLEEALSRAREAGEGRASETDLSQYQVESAAKSSAAALLEESRTEYRQLRALTDSLQRQNELSQRALESSQAQIESQKALLAAKEDEAAQLHELTAQQKQLIAQLRADNGLQLLQQQELYAKLQRDSAHRTQEIESLKLELPRQLQSAADPNAQLEELAHTYQRDTQQLQQQLLELQVLLGRAEEEIQGLQLQLSFTEKQLQQAHLR